MVAELTLVRMCDPALDTSAEGLLARVERLEDAFASGAAVTPAQPVKKATPVAEISEQPIPIPAAPTEAKATAPAAKQRDNKPMQTPPKAAPAPSAAPTQAGRVLHRIRGFMNCVERIRREDTAAASFLTDARAFLDEGEQIVLQLSNPFAEIMLSEPKTKDLLCRALAAELKKDASALKLVLEVCTKEAQTQDTVLDDLLDAAGHNE
jgi:hypothetical protein